VTLPTPLGVGSVTVIGNQGRTVVGIDDICAEEEGERYVLSPLDVDSTPGDQDAVIQDIDVTTCCLGAMP